MNIVLPEYNNKVMKQAMALCSGLNFLKAESLDDALDLIKSKKADALVAGIDTTTRDMVLACKRKLPITASYFSSCFLMKKGDVEIVLADAGVCKKPNAEILKEIIVSTYDTAKQILTIEPRIAMLSFSTLGSGGKDESTSIIKEAIKCAQLENPEIIIDGEMQLDVAICEAVARKKAPESKVAGKANVLICPDLNSGNILYKSMERFGGFTAAGPILQGFGAIVSDLSRGSTVEDVVLVFDTLKKIFDKKHQ